MFVKILKAIANTTFKVDEIVEVPDAIAKAYVDAGYCEESKEGQSALDNTIETEIATLRTGIVGMFKGLSDDIKKAAGSPVITPGEAEADRTKGFGDFVRHVGLAQKYHDAEAAERLVKVYGCEFTDAEGNVKKSHQGAVGTDGGVLAPIEYATELLKLDPETSVIADTVRTVPMGSETKLYPALRQTGKNAPTGGSAMHAGIVTFRKTEKASRDKSTAEFDWIELKATDLTAYTEATRDLLADAPGVESDFLGLIRGALGWRMDWDFLHGPGAGEPVGIYNSPACIAVNRVEAGKLHYLDFVNLLANLMPAYWGVARWVTNVTAFPQIATMKDEEGNNIFLPSSRGVAGGPAGTILGLPVRYTEKAPVLGQAADLALIVPSLYLHGLRSGVEIAVSDQYLFRTDQIAYRAKLRNDGQPWLKAPYRQADGNNTQVSLAAKLKATTS